MIKKHDTLIYRILLVFGECCRNSKTSTPFSLYSFFGNSTFLEYCFAHFKFIEIFREFEGFYPVCRREILEGITHFIHLNVDDFVHKLPVDIFPMIFEQLCTKSLEEYESFSVA